VNTGIAICYTCLRFQPHVSASAFLNADVKLQAVRLPRQHMRCTEGLRLLHSNATTWKPLFDSSARCAKVYEL